jgi:hypothetical protein
VPALPAPARTQFRRFADPAADFVLAVQEVFGVPPRVLDGSRAVQIGDLKLELDGGEHELWLIERHGALERRLAMVEVRGSIDVAVRAAKLEAERVDAGRGAAR